MPPLSVSFRRNFELHHSFCMSRVKYCTTVDPNGYRQWARPSLRVFILKELNAAECEGLASETSEVQCRVSRVNTQLVQGGYYQEHMSHRFKFQAASAHLSFLISSPRTTSNWSWSHHNTLLNTCPQLGLSLTGQT